MTYDELLNSRRITAGSFEVAEVDDLMEAAVRELKSARAVLNIDATMAQDAGYAAMLKAGRALMFSRGFRPRGAGQHATVVQFCRITI